MPMRRRDFFYHRLLLAVLLVCACRAEVDQSTRQPADSQPLTAAAPDPASQSVEPERPEAPAAFEPSGPSGRFTIERPTTEVWGIFAGQCEELHFRPRDDLGGDISVGGRRVRYRLTGNQLELFGFSKLEGDGIIIQACRTVLQLGEDGRLGQADLFADKADCEAGQAAAAPLDDSAALILRKCSGEQLAVDTDEIECGTNGRYAHHRMPGCLSVIAADIARE